jgi:uncharacterized membrane protein
MAHMRGGIRTTSPSGQERYNPNRRDMEQGDAEREGGQTGGSQRESGHGERNVGDTERLLSGILGGGLLLRSVMRPSKMSSGIAALLGIALLHRATSGYCAAYGAMGLTSREGGDTSSIGRRKIQTDRALKMEHSVTINRSPEDLYRFWRQLDNLPKVMSHVRSVEVLDDRRSHWVVETMPGAPTLEWDAEIINEVENERIGWRTVSGATVEHAGSVAFQRAGDGQGTRVTVTLQYDPPAGPIGAAIAGLFGQDPRQKIADDLQRFKETMESQATSSR